MFRWRAVGFGAAVVVVLAFFGLLVPLGGHLAAGLAGGFAAGVLGGGGREGGGRHGLAAGTVGGLVSLVVGLAVAVTVGLETPVLGPLVDVVPVSGTAGLAVVFLGALMVTGGAAFGGALGGQLRGDAPLPGPDERTRPRK